MAKVLLQGNPCLTNGELPSIGSEAPDFILVDAELKDHTLKEFQGQKKVLYIVPSLDTPTCSLSTKKFNQEAEKLGNVIVLVVSADLPFAQKRFCMTENVKNVLTLSMMRSNSFAKDYGVLLIDGPLAGIATRALLILDERNKVLYTELVKEISQEPNYEKALQALY